MTAVIFPPRKKIDALFFTRKRNDFRENNFSLFKDCDYLLLALSLFGTNITPLKRRSEIFKILMHVLRIVQFLVFHFIYVDYIVMIFYYGKANPNATKALCAYGLSATFVFALWHIIRRNKGEMLKVTRKLLHLTCNLDFSYRGISVVNTVTLLIVLVPVLSTPLMVYLMTLHEYRYYTFYFYSEKVERFAQSDYAYLFFKYLAQCVLFEIFPGLVTLLYSTVCFRVCQKLRLYRESFSKFKQETVLSNSCFILRSYLQFIDFIGEIETVFTTVSFFLVVTNSLSVFTILATTFYYAERHVTPPTRAESFFTFITAGLYLIVNISFAAQVTVEVRKNSTLFHLLLEHWKCNKKVLCAEFVVLAEAIKERPVVQLSGCEMFYFKRNSILAVFGTLLTYGLLILQLKN